MGDLLLINALKVVDQADDAVIVLGVPEQNWYKSKID